MLVSLAGLVIGAGVGFLFAVPRVVQDANSTAAVKSSSSLEEVADWFVKLMLGAGLAQLSTIADKIVALAGLVALGFVGADGVTLPGAQAVGLALVVMHPVIGFLLGFLWTRLRLSAAFNSIEQALRRAPELAAKVHDQAAAVLTAPRDKDDLSPVLANGTQAALNELAAMPAEDLKSPEEKLSWAWAKANQVAAAATETGGYAPNVLTQARRVLEGALLENPAMKSTPLADVASRQLDESELFGLLYQPGGPAKAIAAYGDASRWTHLSPQGLGYLVCAYGQQHEQAKDAVEKAKLAAQAWDLMQKAIAKDKSLEQWFRFLLQQDQSSPDNDLASLKSEEQFKTWLAAAL